MKIIRVYPDEELKSHSYGTNSPLVKRIRQLYDYTEMIFPPEMTEEEKAEILREYDVLLTMWASPHVPNSLAQNPGRLKYICNITGGVAGWIDLELVKSDKLTVTNWGDAPAFGVAEGAFALLMAVLKDIPRHIRNTDANGHTKPDGLRSGSLFNLKVAIFGMGVIGRQFVEFLRPFKPQIYAYDPYVAQMPEGVTRVDSMDALFDNAQVLVIHAGLTKETRGIIKKEHLAKLPDGGIIINTARGPIVEREALVAEIASGRLRAGLDVFYPDETFYPDDTPEDDSPLRRNINCILTAHHVTDGEWGVDPNDLCKTALNCLENLERMAKGETPKYIVDERRYKLMTQ